MGRLARHVLSGWGVPSRDYRRELWREPHEMRRQGREPQQAHPLPRRTHANVRARSRGGRAWRRSRAHLWHDACLPLSENKPHVVPAAARIPVRVRVPDVVECAQHRVGEVGSPRDALVEKDGHVEELGARRVERARKIVVQ